MNEITCKICGDKFTPYKSRRYEVIIPSTSFGLYSQPRIGEAFDCPMCGCQHIVNTRYKAVTETLRFQGILPKKEAERILDALEKTESEESKEDLNSPFGCITCKYGKNMTVLRCRECEPPWWKNYEPKTESEDKNENSN